MKVSYLLEQLSNHHDVHIICCEISRKSYYPPTLLHHFTLSSIYRYVFTHEPLNDRYQIEAIIHAAMWRLKTTCTHCSQGVPPVNLCMHLGKVHLYYKMHKRYPEQITFLSSTHIIKLTFISKPLQQIFFLGSLQFCCP